ncbi:MAG: Hsp20 family protein, partial [Lysobacterales bacterium]
SDEPCVYLHRGFATLSFERRFNLADHVKVTGASLENGLLHIDLEREIPEAMKPRTIKIGKSASRLLDSEKSTRKKVTQDHKDEAA